MKPIIRDISEMTDSRELMESKVHPVIAIFIGLLFTILVVALAWTYFGEMDIVVKANGVVRPNEKVSKITNKVLSKIISVNYEAGQKVKKGQLLYALERNSLENEQRVVSGELQKTKTELVSLIDFKNRILANKTGGFSSNEEKEAYQQILLSDQTAVQKLKVELDGLDIHINETKEELVNLALLEKSIRSNTNLFKSKKNDFYYKYADYEIKKKQLDVQKRKVTEQFKSLLGEVDLDDGKKQVEDVQLNLENYLNEYVLNLRMSIQDKEKQLQTLQQIAPKIYLAINDEIKANKDKINNLEERMKSVALSSADYELRAPIDGIVNVITEINEGDLLQPGAEVVTIVPEHNSEYVVQLALLNKDIADIKAGDKIKYNFLALPSKEYSQSIGTISLVSPDATVNQQNGASYYMVEATIENKALYNKKGEAAHIKVGMVSEAHIITSSKKILYYLLEKIDLKE